MFNSKKNPLFYDSPKEISCESKYITSFFIYFSLAYIIVYAFLVVCASYVTGLNIAHSKKWLLQLIISQLMMPVIYIVTKVFTRKLSCAKHPVMSKMSVKSFLKLLTVAVFILVTGAAVASYAVELISAISGEVPQNYVARTVEEMALWEIIVFVVIIAPIFEELLFRKLMIDKLSKYGTSFCVGVSAFVFGLVHGNFYQFFYAFGLGALMGFVYCVYGKIIYSILIHAFINALGSVVPIVLDISQTSEVTSAQKIYLFVYLSLVVCGGINLFRNYHRLRYVQTSGLLITPSKALLKSWGFIACVVIFTIELILNTIA